MSEQNKTDQLQELEDKALDTAQGGAIFAKYDGVDGESPTHAHNEVAFDLCDPIYRRIR